VAAVVLVVAIVALAVMALVSNRSVRSVTEVRPVTRTVPAAPTPAPATDLAPHLAPPALAPAGVPTLHARPAAPVIADAAPASAPPVAEPASVDAAALPDCPQLGLPAPQKVGGLASIVPLVPLFGPFSAEAFAFMPAFQPGFVFLGPLLPEAERALTDLQPLLDVLSPGAQALGQAGFDAIAPLYGPVRPQFLSAETDLATAIAPVLDALVSAPGAECVIALEGVLATALAGRPGLSAP
jgi:hypothetical protein